MAKAHRNDFGWSGPARFPLASCLGPVSCINSTRTSGQNQASDERPTAPSGSKVLVSPCSDYHKLILNSYCSFLIKAFSNLLKDLPLYTGDWGYLPQPAPASNLWLLASRTYRVGHGFPNPSKVGSRTGPKIWTSSCLLLWDALGKYFISQRPCLFELLQSDIREMKALVQQAVALQCSSKGLNQFDFSNNTITSGFQADLFLRISFPFRGKSPGI